MVFGAGKERAFGGYRNVANRHIVGEIPYSHGSGFIALPQQCGNKHFGSGFLRRRSNDRVRHGAAGGTHEAMGYLL